jgi:hypothetical protein
MEREAMSIETEEKRLNDFLAEQTAAHEATKDRARAHRDSAVALADQAIDALVKHTNDQLATAGRSRKKAADENA